MEEGTGGDPEESLLAYRTSSEQLEGGDRPYLSTLQRLSTSELGRLARRLGISERSLWRYRSGKAVSPRNERLLGQWLKTRG